MLSPPANAGYADFIPGSGIFPGEGNGDPFQYSCLGNPMDRGACRRTVFEVGKESDTTQWLNNSQRKLGLVLLCLSLSQWESRRTHLIPLALVTTHVYEMLAGKEARRDSVPRLVMKAPSAYHIEKFQIPRGKTAVQYKPLFWVQFRHSEPHSGNGNSLKIQVLTTAKSQPGKSS